VELEADRLVRNEELLGRKLLADRLDLGPECRLELLEERQEELVEQVQHLVVVRVKGYLEIEAHELSQVAVRVRVFGTEDCREQDVSGPRRSWSSDSQGSANAPGAIS
jgi:hypothetical protein